MYRYTGVCAITRYIGDVRHHLPVARVHFCYGPSPENGYAVAVVAAVDAATPAAVSAAAVAAVSAAAAQRRDSLCNLRGLFQWHIAHAFDALHTFPTKLLAFRCCVPCGRELWSTTVVYIG